MKKKELFQEHLPELVKGITNSYFEDDPSISYFKKDLPNRDDIIEIIHLLRQLVFPGVFTPQICDKVEHVMEACTQQAAEDADQQCKQGPFAKSLYDSFGVMQFVQQGHSDRLISLFMGVL
jgi:hypothetical protein